MTSGIAINDELITAFTAMKLSKTTQYLIFKLSDDLKSVVVDKTGVFGAPWTDFTKEFPKDDGRYAVFHFNFKQEQGGGDRSKVCAFHVNLEFSFLVASLYSVDTRRC